MEQIRKKRGAVRRKINKFCSKAEELVNQPEVDEDQIREFIDKLVALVDEVGELDKKVIEGMRASNESAQRLEAAGLEQTAYAMALKEAEKKLQQKLREQANDQEQTEDPPAPNPNEHLEEELRNLSTKRIGFKNTTWETCDQMLEESKKEVVDEDLIIALVKILDSQILELEEMDRQILDLMLNLRKDQVSIEGEQKLASYFRRDAIIVKTRVERFLNQTVCSSQTNCDTVCSKSEDGKPVMKLPRKTPSKFDGQIQNWLKWWNEFKSIHNSKAITIEDKFYYLRQSMEEGTKAARAIECYLSSPENYEVAINALKTRFGDEDILKHYYLREIQDIAHLCQRQKIPISELSDMIEAKLNSLKSLKIPPDVLSTWIIPVMEGCLTKELSLVWYRRQTLKTAKKSEIDLFLEFLQEESKYELRKELLDSSLSQRTQQKRKEPHHNNTRNNNEAPLKKPKPSEVPTMAGLHVAETKQEKSLCIFCKKDHRSDNCYFAMKWNKEKRKQRIKDSGACFKCLRQTHKALKCMRPATCNKCKGTHPTVNCFKGQDTQHNRRDKDEKQNRKEGEKVKHESVNSQIQCRSDILLGTCVVLVKGARRSVRVRFLVDNGAQTSHIGSRVFQYVDSPIIRQELIGTIVFGGGIEERKMINVRKVTLSSTTGKCQRSWKMYERETVCPGIPRAPDGPWTEALHQRGIEISDTYRTPVDLEEVEMLIGRDHMSELMTGRRIRLMGGLYAEETIFGWTLGGPLPVHELSNLLFVTHNTTTPVIEKIWNIESIGINDPIQTKTKEEEELEAKRIFNETVKKEEDGRYIVQMPWIPHQKEKLSSNIFIAKKTLQSITNRLKQKEQLHTYHEIFQDWENQGFIEEVHDQKEENCHYLNHHPVFKIDSTSTPVRPVFNASFKTNKHPSLNDCLFTGPNMMEQISSILHRFRMKPIGITSDIRKAFQMVAIVPEERDYFRFIWWSDEMCTTIKIFRHKRIIFGGNCSPWILAAVLHHHLSSITDDRKDVADKLLEAFYVDNCVTSVDTVQEKERFQVIATELLAEICMELRQWEFSAISQPQQRNEGTGDFKVLGLLWNKESDTLSCDVSDVKMDGSVTKRKILSCIQKAFDPNGFLSPALLLPKLILQDAWRKKQGWDKDLDELKQREFLKWVEQVHLLQGFSIPRQMIYGNEYEIHTFVDASKYAYAVVTYIRSGSDGDVGINIAHAKSRLAPIQGGTIPRLELMACVIGARISNYVLSSLKGSAKSVTLWSDSSTALAWIKRDGIWGQFVNNRVQEINATFSPESWRYVPTALNPADVASRGCSPQQLMESDWDKGPLWLYRHRGEWPQDISQVDEDLVQAEVKKSKLVVQLAHLFPIEPDSFLFPNGKLRYSSYHKYLKLVGWAIRFRDNIRKKRDGQPRLTEPALSSSEIKSAEIALIKIIQQQTLDILNKELQKFSPCYEDGLIKVESRLIYKEDTSSFKTPIVLSAQHPLVKLMVIDLHQSLWHAGVRLVLSRLREKFWIIRGQREVKKILWNCYKCKKQRSKPFEVTAAPLPKKRVDETAGVFETTGIDLFGPMHLSNGEKVWGVIFTCAVFRCVHLDLVQSLDSESFIRCLERFLAHYGRPSDLFTDNGTNFVGAKNLIQSAGWKWWEQLVSSCKTRPLNWNFIPPTAPWYGGWWERLISIIKTPMRKTLAKNHLTYDELRTVLASLQATINDRPLTYLSEDQDDLICLTPAMFLHPIRHTSLVELSSGSGMNILGKAYRRMKTVQLALQARFRSEYLAGMIQGRGGKSSKVNVGDIVMIGNDNKKKHEWNVGRIVSLITGPDGNIRVAQVQTPHQYKLVKDKKGKTEVKVQNGPVLTRALQSLYPLEVNSSQEIPITEETKKLARDEDHSRKGQVLRMKMTDKAETKDTVTRSGRRVQKPNRYGDWVQNLVLITVEE